MVANPRLSTAIVSGLFFLAIVTACGQPGQLERAHDPSPIGVEPTDSTCHLRQTTMPAGNITFDIANSGTKVSEFYLYAAGDQIMGEVENIAPGLRRRLIVQVPTEAGTKRRANQE
jgi:iron uptake system component EfeO